MNTHFDRGILTCRDNTGELLPMKFFINFDTTGKTRWQAAVAYWEELKLKSEWAENWTPISIDNAPEHPIW